jgi:hypothetical protein
MPNGRAPVGGLILATLLAGAVLLWLQPYSVISPYRAYTEPARRFLRAALAQDTLELQRQAVSAQPVQWALDAAQGTRLCYLRPVTMAFVRGAKGPQLAVASSSCFAAR